MKNIAEILKNCPKGTKLYSTVFGEVTLDYTTSLSIVIRDSINNARHFYTNGKLDHKGECVLFPSKENKDWSTFQGPFKDGDIVFYNDTISIFKEWGDETLFRTYVCTYLGIDVLDIDVPLFGKSIKKEIRFATEEEKEKIVKVIKDNGYKWNPETKTLEKLIEPKFKVGDEIVRRNSARFPGRNSWIVVNINSKFYEIKLSKGIGGIGVIPISEQDDWELVLDGPKFKVGDRIKSNYNGLQYDIKELTDTHYILVEVEYKLKYTVPIAEDKKWELAPVVPKFKVGDRIRAKKDAPINISNILITEVNEGSYNGFIGYTTNTAYIHFRHQDLYELVPNKFDISSLKPFNEVLVRYDNLSKWTAGIFSHTVKSNNKPYFIVNTQYWEQCIPYKGNEHLVDTTDECDEYFKNW